MKNQIKTIQIAASRNYRPAVDIFRYKDDDSSDSFVKVHWNITPTSARRAFRAIEKLAATNEARWEGEK